VLLPIIATKKTKKSLAYSSYVNSCATLEPKLVDSTNALLDKFIKQTTLISKIIVKLRVIRTTLSYYV
jgi:hypothetical protein